MTLENIDIAILCGGKGTRLAPVIGNIPKVLAPIGKTTPLDVIVGQLRKFGAHRFTLLAGYLGDQIVTWANNYAGDVEFNVHIESEQRSTGRAVIDARHNLKSDPIMVVNGDTITNANIGRMMEVYYRYGDPLEAATLWVRRLPTHNNTNAGYYLISQRLLQRTIHPKFELYIGKHIHELGRVTQTRAWFLDIGTPRTYALAQQYVGIVDTQDWIPDAIRA